MVDRAVVSPPRSSSHLLVDLSKQGILHTLNDDILDKEIEVVSDSGQVAANAAVGYSALSRLIEAYDVELEEDEKFVGWNLEAL